jgi:hypothetical protein
VPYRSGCVRALAISLCLMIIPLKSI